MCIHIKKDIDKKFVRNGLEQILKFFQTIKIAQNWILTTNMERGWSVDAKTTIISPIVFADLELFKI